MHVRSALGLGKKKDETKPEVKMEGLLKILPIHHSKKDKKLKDFVTGAVSSGLKMRKEVRKLIMKDNPLGAIEKLTSSLS
jgi:hypothetical protein